MARPGREVVCAGDRRASVGAGDLGLDDLGVAPRLDGAAFLGLGLDGLDLEREVDRGRDIVL